MCNGIIQLVFVANIRKVFRLGFENSILNIHFSNVVVYQVHVCKVGQCLITFGIDFTYM